MYDYFLGGKDHFAVDRHTAAHVLTMVPTARTAARENRSFLGRAVRYLVSEAGVRQFLDIGTGLPSATNVHDAAQRIAPECRVVYVDNDPVVMAHARALLTSSPEGETAYIEADLRDPARILADPITRKVLDFTQPVALMLVAILHFVSDTEGAAGIVATLMDALPPGSYLTLSHVTADFYPDETVGPRVARAYQGAGVPLVIRTAGEISDMAFTGLRVVPPGLVSVSDWRPGDDDPRPLPQDVNYYGGMAFKP